ncbi:oxysterol-binding protein-related protein 4C-like protein [Anopheles sinensis]|uniref:Oxysterol-binding protein-related protein 4C-like protein n=1 Tax=Anopheles sinensis TaxID=74873 RepID=A0A084WF56_ANOSI|nr:oxysterol-binding protein-related protein 4C-like protein [Anopheles sinensis]
MKPDCLREGCTRIPPGRFWAGNVRQSCIASLQHEQHRAGIKDGIAGNSEDISCRLCSLSLMPWAPIAGEIPRTVTCPTAQELMQLGVAASLRAQEVAKKVQGATQKVRVPARCREIPELMPNN